MSILQNITTNGVENLAFDHEGGWVGITPMSNWALNAGMSLGLTLTTFLAAKEDLRVWLTAKEYDSAFKSRSYSGTVLGIPQFLPAIAYIALVCNVMAVSLQDSSNSTITRISSVIASAALSFVSASSVFEVLVDASCVRMLVRPTAPSHIIPLASVADCHRRRFYLCLIAGGIIGTIVGIYPNVYSLAATLVAFNYAAVKQALHWVYLDIVSTRGLVFGAFAVTALASVGASLIPYAMPNMEIRDSSLVVLSFSTIPLALIFPIISSTIRYESQDSESITLSEKELPVNAPIKVRRVLGDSSVTLPTTPVAFARPLSFIETKIKFARFRLFYTLMFIQFLCYVPQIILLHPFVVEHIIKPTVGLDGEPSAWWGLLLSLPGSYLAAVAIPFTATVVRFVRADGAEYWSFQDGILLQ